MFDWLLKTPLTLQYLFFFFLFYYNKIHPATNYKAIKNYINERRQHRTMFFLNKQNNSNNNKKQKNNNKENEMKLLAPAPLPFNFERSINQSYDQ